ncbi:MAG TPA: HAMP domain-containing sensor histidine kinase [Myxococcales bacterium]|nr:HAMP domain-containing sensor histidine kinase [Myxococcales bacterium]
MRRLPRLRTVLLSLNVALFLLPFGTLAILRTYDHQLIRQTEAELLVQGAFVVESYRHALAAALHRDDPRPPPDPTGVLTTTFPEDLASESSLPTAPDATAPSVPASTEDGVAAAVGTELAPVVQGAAAQTLAGIRLLDSRGVVVATSRSELGLSLAARPEVAGALAGRPVSLLRRRREKERDAPITSASRNTGVRVFVALPVEVAGRTLGAVVLSRTPMSFGKAFYQDRYYLLVTAAVLLAAVLLVSLLAAAWVVRPVRALALQAEAVADGRADEARLDRPVTREVAALADAVSRMGRALRERAEAVRAFAASVSHELKTPLTSLKGSVELLQDAPAMAPEQRARFLEIVAADTERLDRLVDRMLDLARADVAQGGEARADAGEIIAALAAEERAAGRSLEIEVAADLPRVRMGPDLLSTVLESLVQNARVHGGHKITVRAGASDGHVRVAVQDDGPGVSPGNRARVFEPFFTTARERGGTGLGLTIAQRLVQAHRGRIVLLDAAPGVGACFEIELPVG